MSNDDEIDDSFEDEFDFLDDDEDFSDKEESFGEEPSSGAGKSAGSPLPKVLAGGFVLVGLGAGGFFYMNQQQNKPFPELPSAGPSLGQNTAGNNTQREATTDLTARFESEETSEPITTAKAPPSPPLPQQTEKSEFEDIAKALATGEKGTEPDLLAQATERTSKSSSLDQLEKELLYNREGTDFSGTDTLPTQTQLPNVAQVQADPEINRTLESITQEMTMNVNQIKQMESSIQEVSQTLSRLNQTIAAMDNRVLGLTETVEGLSQDLVNVKKVITDEDLDLASGAARQSNDQPLIYSAPEYIVHAIIPGRAWLKSTSGQIITVTEGDTMGDYGKVAVIDAANSLVRTSSGISFR